jgi:hypothetical protein
LPYLAFAMVANGVVIPGGHPSNTGGEYLDKAPARQQLPSALIADECDATPSVDELPNERFIRKGGRMLRVPVRERHGILTSDGIEQGRNIGQYDRLDLVSKAVFANERPQDPTLAKARLFLWQHWKDQRLGYLTLTQSSVDARSTSHIFVEQESNGRWRVAWRRVRHSGRIHDSPTYYGVEWVIPGGWREPGTPLPQGEQPDSKRHRLEFRDACSDVEHSL